MVPGAGHERSRALSRATDAAALTLRLRRSRRRRLAQRTSQITLHAIEDTVDETSRVGPAEQLRQLDCFVNRNDRRNVVAIQHLKNCEPQDIAIDRRNALEIEKKYETEKKESQIRQLEADKKVQKLSLQRSGFFNYTLLGGILVLGIIFLLSYRTYKQKQILQQHRIAELETEKKLNAIEAMLKGEEKERSRLAKDLHDGLGGMLSGIKYSFNTMKGNLVMTTENHQAFERSMDMLDSSIKEMRRVAHNMMPDSLVRFGLDTALKDFCNDINQSGALQVKYQSIGMSDSMIEQTTSITLYRIVQELVNNTIKHAAAETAIVQVMKGDNRLSVTVEDDGKGFDSSAIKHIGGMGWSNIQHRVDFLKGKLDLDTRPGKGTSVHIEFDI